MSAPKGEQGGKPTMLLSEVTIVYGYPEADSSDHVGPCSVELVDAAGEIVATITGKAARGIGQLLENYQTFRRMRDEPQRQRQVGALTALEEPK